MMIFCSFLLLVCVSAQVPLTYRQLRAWAPLYWGFSIIGQLFAVHLLIASLLLLCFSRDFSSALIALLACCAASLECWRQLRVRALAVKTAVATKLGSSLDFKIKCSDLVRWLTAFRWQVRGVKVDKNLAYGDLSAQRIDLYRLDDGQDQRPILIHIHGGAWVTGKKGQMGKPLIFEMAQAGWLVCDIEYRLGPESRYPAMIEDVLKGIAWIKANAEQFGGNANFVALTGGSAGGHLTSLAGLLPEAARQDLCDADTAVQAVVPVYGRYDFLDRDKIINHSKITNFMNTQVMPGAVEDIGEAMWRQASPIDNVGAHQPPCLLIHGSGDCLIDYKEALAFISAQAAVATNAFHTFIAPRSQHAFDLTHSIQSDAINRLVHLFLQDCYQCFLSAEASAHS